MTSAAFMKYQGLDDVKAGMLPEAREVVAVLSAYAGGLATRKQWKMNCSSVVNFLLNEAADLSVSTHQEYLESTGLTRCFYNQIASTVCI